MLYNIHLIYFSDSDLPAVRLAGLLYFYHSAKAIIFVINKKYDYSQITA